MTYDEAKSLPASERVAGLEVEGNIPPFGGTWKGEVDGSKITLVEAPTGEAPPTPPTETPSSE